jgi:hypothetical protein
MRGVTIPQVDKSRKEMDLFNSEKCHLSATIWSGMEYTFESRLSSKNTAEQTGGTLTEVMWRGPFSVRRSTCFLICAPKSSPHTQPA